MLGKLIKYDLKANLKIFLLMYAVLLGTALGTRFLLIEWWMPEFDESIAMTIISMFLTLSYGVALIAINVLCIVLIVRRFYNNLFGSEGYLSFTLPVTAAQHFVSKVISAIIWYVSSIVVQVASILILSVGTFDYELTQEDAMILDFYKDMFGEMISTRDIVLQSILWVFGLLASLFLIYFAICVGQMVNRHRVIASIVIYFGANSLINTIQNVTMQEFFAIEESGMSVTMEFSTGYYVVSAIFLLLRLVLFAGGSIWIMKKKVNLE